MKLIMPYLVQRNIDVGDTKFKRREKKGKEKLQFLASRQRFTLNNKFLGQKEHSGFDTVVRHIPATRF
jgi:hypothetical protein